MCIVRQSLFITNLSYGVHARVCACVGLFAGCGCGDVVAVMGLHAVYVQRILRELVEEGRISREWLGRRWIYRLVKCGREWLGRLVAEAELAALALLARAKASGRWPRVGAIEQMEEALRKGSV